MYLPTPLGFKLEGKDWTCAVELLTWRACSKVACICMYLYCSLIKLFFVPCIFGVRAPFENNTYIKVFCRPDQSTCIVKIF